MRRLLIVLLLAGAAAYAQTVTTVSDTVIAPNGSPTGVNGTIFAEMSGSCTQGGFTIRPAPIRITVQNGVLKRAGGTVGQPLVPSDSCTEGTTAYAVRYDVSGPGGKIKIGLQLYWTVPTSGSTVTIDAIESANVGVQTATFGIAGLTGLGLGELLVGTAGVPAALPVGASARLLQISGGTAVWSAMSGDATIAAGGAVTLATVPLAKGGTNQTSWTAARCVQVNAGGTALEAAAAACGSGGGGAVTSIIGTALQITASAPTGDVTLSIPTNPTLPGTTTGTFSGNLTGNASGSAATITGALVLGNTPLTTRGDLFIANTATPVLARLAKGTQYQTLQGGVSDLLYDAVHLDQATAITGVLPDANVATSIARLASPVLVTPTLGAALATSIAFGADPADAGAIRGSNNAVLIAAEIATPGTDMTLTPNASDQWAFSHTVTAPGFSTTGSAAGIIGLTGGTAPTPATNEVVIAAPAAVTTPYEIRLPAASATGFLLGTNAANVNTVSYVAFSGTVDVVRSTSPTITDPFLGNSTEGTCNSGNRGKVTIVQGGAGVADTVRLCRKDATDTYAWTPVI